MNLPSTVDARSVLVDPVLWAAIALGVGSARGFASQEAADLERRGELESLDVSAADPIAARPTENPQERFKLEPPVGLRKGSSPDPFFISWCSQREVAGADSRVAGFPVHLVWPHSHPGGFMGAERKLRSALDGSRRPPHRSCEFGEATVTTSYNRIAGQSIKRLPP